MLELVVSYTGLSYGAVGVSSVVLFIIAVLGIISALSKPSTRKPPTSTGRKKKKHLRGKHTFLHRPSLLDSGMALVLPWRHDTSRSNVMKKSVFRGWYNLCWIIGGAWNLQYFLNNYKKKGSLINNIDWFLSLFHFLHELILVLLPIYALSFSAFILQKLISLNVFGPKYTRPILHFIQHGIQTVMIFGVGMFVFCFCEHWPFTQKLCLTLETFCLYMKMHSYMLSNQELHEMKYGLKCAKKCDDNDSDDKSIQTPEDVDRMTDEQVIKELGVHGLRDFSAINICNLKPSNFCYFVQDNTQVNIYGFSSCYKNRNTSICSPLELDTNQSMSHSPGDDNNGTASASASCSSMADDSDQILIADSKKVQQLHKQIERLQEIEDKELERYYRRIVLKDTLFLQNYRKQIYPQNVTLYNWIEFTFFPTLVYEPLYPRTSSVRVIYIVEKTFIIIAVMSFMFAVLETFVLKPLSKESQSEPIQTIINLLVPAILLEVCGFFIVFDCMLNCFAEITCFADREFYQDWWNSTSFEEFARKWNRPVHEFLLRHVYYESMNTYQLSKNLALAGTFVFSIALHEVILCACLHKFNPVLAVMSLFQLPLMPIMKSSAFKNKPLGNIVFWVGIILGMPMTCVLYAKDYCSTYDCTVSNS